MPVPEAPRGVSKVDLTLSIDRDLVVSASAVAHPRAKVIDLLVSDIPWRIRPKTLEELKKDREEKQRSSKAKEALLKYCHDLDEKMAEMKVSKTGVRERNGTSRTSAKKKSDQVLKSRCTLYPFIASPFPLVLQANTDNH